MTDVFDFETRLEERLRARAALASRPFDSAAIAHEAITAGARRRWIGRLDWPSRSPLLVWLIVGLLLAVALLGAVAVVGALLRERESVLLPRAAGWSATESMSVRRADHTATLLADGMVLVVGGSDMSSGPFASAELYNPTTGSWTATGSMHTARSNHTATLLRDGRVLVAGGINGSRPIDGSSPFASAELYDPATGSWTATGSMHTARSNHTATLLRDGRVLVAGGRYTSRSPSAAAELYDPATGLWTPTGAMIQSRAFHTATLLPDDNVLVAGGEGVLGVVGEGGTNNLTVLNTAEVYRVTTGSWSFTGSMHGHREAGGALLLPDGRVLEAGGTTFGVRLPMTSAELYDPAKGSWSVTGSMQNVRDFLTASLLSDGRVLAAGGADDAAEPALLAEVYDPRTGLWAASGTMIEARLEATATVLPDGSVLVTGGRVNEYGNALAGAEIFNPGRGP